MDTVVVFTGKNLEAMFEVGGSGDWKANEDSLKKCQYIVAVANTSHLDINRHVGTKHGHAFMVGRIVGVVDAPEIPGRKIIQFDEYAEIDVPDAWGGQRNPVRYTSLSEFGLSHDELEWIPFPKDRVKEYDSTPELTIEEAKKGLAKKMGISPDCIEITIRA